MGAGASDREHYPDGAVADSSRFFVTVPNFVPTPRLARTLDRLANLERHSHPPEVGVRVKRHSASEHDPGIRIYVSIQSTFCSPLTVRASDGRE